MSVWFSSVMPVWGMAWLSNGEGVSIYFFTFMGDISAILFSLQSPI